MEVTHYLSFFAHESDIKAIEKLLLENNIHVTTPKIIYNEVFYEIPIQYNDQNTLEFIEKIYADLENKYNLHIGQRINFQFDDSDFNKSPLFTLNSTGNSQQAFLEDKGSSFSSIDLCSNCGLQYRELNSPLVINTAALKNRFMVNADTAYWVILKKWQG